MSQLRMFGQNIWLLVGILTAALLLFFLLTVGLTGLKVWLFRRGQEQGERESRLERSFPDGSPKPPVGPGLCDQCGHAFPDVFHLPSGTRRCGGCYDSPTDSGSQSVSEPRDGL